MNGENNSSQPSTPNIVVSQKVTAIRGKFWLIDSWKTFKQYPMAWIVTMFVMFIITLILAVVPIIQLLLPVATCLFFGGLMLGCKEGKQGQPFNINYLFKGFEHETANLLVAGLLYFGGLIFCSMLAVNLASLMGFEIVQLKPEDLQGILDGSFDMAPFLQSLLIPMLFFLGLLVPLLMAFWFAPALIVLRKMKPIDAYKLSFKACNQNIGAFMVYGLYGVIALFIFLSLFVLAQLLALFVPILAVPVLIALEMSFMAILIISVYQSYEDIFPVEDEPSEQTPEAPIDPPGQMTV